MAIKQPPREPEAVSAVKFAEQLVRKSLAINPGMRGSGESTHDYLVRMRDIALSQAKGASPGKGVPAAASTPTKSMAARRDETASNFLTQKQDYFHQGISGLRERMEVLRKEEQSMRERVVQEITEFMIVVWSEVDVAESQATLKKFRAFLAELGITEVDLVKRARSRR